ncbi:hypothetical protein HMPREF9057_02871, partial [Actinomyces sp. oral taxon 171 str. F0337]
MLWASRHRWGAVRVTGPCCSTYMKAATSARLIAAMTQAVTNM